jgi:hypothetical protein
MKTNIVTHRFLTVIFLSLVAAGITHGTQPANEPPIRFQWLNVGPSFEAARVDAVGKAIGFQNWPQTDVRYVAPMIDKSLLLHPELITRELSTYDIVYFGKTPWGICKWSCGHLNENPEPLPTEIPPDRKENLLAHLTPEERDDPNFVEKYLSRKLDSYRQSKKYHLDGSINIWICLAPSSQAAQEYLLHTMTQNSMPTEALAIGYASDKRPEDLGTISFLTESTHKDDIRIKFVRNNICLNIRADGCFATEALPLARKIDAMLLAQQPLTHEQLLARRPVVTISSDVDKVRMNGCRTVSYNISVPSGQDIVCARASCREGQYQAAKDGKITLPDKMGKVKVKLIAITHELLTNTFEREVIIPE